MDSAPTMNNTVCPQGGFHEFEPVKGDTDFVAGIAAGACSTCLFCIWWPLLLCGARCEGPGRRACVRAAPLRRAPSYWRRRGPNALTNASSCGCAASDALPSRVRLRSAGVLLRACPAPRAQPGSGADVARGVRAQGGRELSKDVADKQCTKCALLVDRKGQLKAQPSNVPEKNPVSGQPNSFYGWSPAGGAKQVDAAAAHQE